VKRNLFSSTKTHSFLLLIILLIGGVCRFYNLNWDDGYNYHPDEMNITAAVSRIAIPGQMDPGFFAYNGFPIYLYRAAAQILAKITGDPSWTGEWSKIALIGRFLSALFSTLSIYLIYWIGKKTINEKAALLAAYLTAVTVGFIQTAHYGVTESLLLFLLLAISVCGITLVKGTTLLSPCWYAMALLSGLALGTKTSALSFLVIPAVAGAILFFREKYGAVVVRALSFCALTLVTAIMISPYSLVNFSAFTASMEYEGAVVRGILKVPYTLQFHNAIPYWFFFKNLHWHTGPIIPAVGMLGMCFWLVLIGRRKESVAALPLLCFGILYWGYVGSWYAKFIRYTVFIMPLLILSTCWLCDRFSGYRRVKPLAVIIILLTLITSTFWAGAFMSIYRSPATRTAASRWMYENIPPDSVILREHWDYGLPVPLRDRQDPSFRFEIMNNYDPDTEAKVRVMSRALEGGDYLIVGSRRLSGTIGKSHDTYPLTSRYYEKLFDGRLGYTPVRTFSSYPALWGFAINDDSAEETFQVFDHPLVHIFKNSEELPASRILKILREE
jgi:4-amino-4-deoxy-L-arabinose transferase-like glycosyltransferase